MGEAYDQFKIDIKQNNILLSEEQNQLIHQWPPADFLLADNQNYLIIFYKINFAFNRFIFPVKKDIKRN